MNITILIAGILSLLAFLAHAFVGDREYIQLKPSPESAEKTRETWVQARGGWHWVSVDLLLSGVLLILIATGSFIQAASQILLLLCIYFFVTGAVWLTTVFVSRNNNKQLLMLGQWIFCFVVGGLIYIGGDF